MKTSTRILVAAIAGALIDVPPIDARSSARNHVTPSNPTVRRRRQVRWVKRNLSGRNTNESYDVQTHSNDNKSIAQAMMEGLVEATSGGGGGPKIPPSSDSGESRIDADNTSSGAAEADVIPSTVDTVAPITEHADTTISGDSIVGNTPWGAKADMIQSAPTQVTSIGGSSSSQNEDEAAAILLLHDTGEDISVDPPFLDVSESTNSTALPITSSMTALTTNTFVENSPAGFSDDLDMSMSMVLSDPREDIYANAVMDATEAAAEGVANHSPESDMVADEESFTVSPTKSPSKSPTVSPTGSPTISPTMTLAKSPTAWPEDIVQNEVSSIILDTHEDIATAYEVEDLSYVPFDLSMSFLMSSADPENQDAASSSTITLTEKEVSISIPDEDAIVLSESSGPIIMNSPGTDSSDRDTIQLTADAIAAQLEIEQDGAEIEEYTVVSSSSVSESVPLETDVLTNSAEDIASETSTSPPTTATYVMTDENTDESKQHKDNISMPSESTGSQSISEEVLSSTGETVTTTQSTTSSTMSTESHQDTKITIVSENLPNWSVVTKSNLLAAVMGSVLIMMW